MMTHTIGSDTLGASMSQTMTEATGTFSKKRNSINTKIKRSTSNLNKRSKSRGSNNSNLSSKSLTATHKVRFQNAIAIYSESMSKNKDIAMLTQDSYRSNYSTTAFQEDQPTPTVINPPLTARTPHSNVRVKKPKKPLIVKESFKETMNTYQSKQSPSKPAPYSPNRFGDSPKKQL